MAIGTVSKTNFDDSADSIRGAEAIRAEIVFKVTADSIADAWETIGTCLNLFKGLAKVVVVAKKTIGTLAVLFKLANTIVVAWKTRRIAKKVLIIVAVERIGIAWVAIGTVTKGFTTRANAIIVARLAIRT